MYIAKTYCATLAMSRPDYRDLVGINWAMLISYTYPKFYEEGKLDIKFRICLLI